MYFVSDSHVCTPHVCKNASSNFFFSFYFSEMIILSLVMLVTCSCGLGYDQIAFVCKFCDVFKFSLTSFCCLFWFYGFEGNDWLIVLRLWRIQSRISRDEGVLSRCHQLKCSGQVKMGHVTKMIKTKVLMCKLFCVAGLFRALSYL